MPVAEASQSRSAIGNRIVLSLIIRVKLDRWKGREQLLKKMRVLFESRLYLLEVGWNCIYFLIQLKKKKENN